MELTLKQILEKSVKAHKEGKLDKAELNYKEVLAIQPNHLIAHINLGAVLNGLGKFAESEMIYKEAINLKPNFAIAYNNLGGTLQKLNKFKESEKNFKKAIELKSDYFDAYINLGNLQKNNNQFDDAKTNYKKALELKPDSEIIHFYLGLLFYRSHNFVEAEISFKKAIELKPDYASAYFGLANVLIKVKRPNEAIKNYEHAKIINPEFDYLLGSLLHVKMRLCIWDDFYSDVKELIKKIENSDKVIFPFALLSLIDDPIIHKKFAEIYSTSYSTLKNFKKILPYQNHKKIKIGYFSSDFRDHPVGSLTAELYKTHNRDKFEIYAFSLTDIKDEINKTIRMNVDHFYDVQKISNSDLVKLSRSLEIDIAINLTGYTGGSRTGIFAMSVAPVQVSFLGYNGTMGSNYTDYIILDHIIAPKNKQKDYSEKVVYLPNSYMPNESIINFSEKVFTKSDFGLPREAFIFCCFNNHYKINPSIFKRWMKILSKVNGSVLFLTSGHSTAMINLKNEAKKNGINENRLIFAPRLSLKEDHMSRMKFADLFLDTLPFNAHTTASDALRAGVPVLTCIGEAFAGRVAASLLNAVGLSELVTKTHEEYETLAIDLAKNPQKLKIIKEKLVKNLPTAPLYDTPLFTKHLEAAYQTMYEKNQEGLEPNVIEINN